MKKWIILFLMLGLGFTQSAYIINSANATTDVYDSSAYKVYGDTFGTNPDFGLKLCSVGSQYVGAVYSINSSGSLIYTVISWNLTTGSTASLVYTQNAQPGGCFSTPIDSFAFSQFRDNTRTPPVYVSAFPGRIHALYSSAITGTSPGLILVPTANGWLRGSYTVPLSTASFNQATGRVSSTVTSIIFETDVGSVSKAPSDADWGLNAATGRSIVMGLCSDTGGDNCSDGVIVNSSAQLPQLLSVGGIPINDQYTYNRYVVVDGLAYGPLCIGSNLVASVSTTPGSVNPGGTSNISVTVTNNGNVNVTTAFVITLNTTGPSGFFEQRNWTISQIIPPGGSVSRSYIFTNTSKSGTFTFSALADSTNAIAKCDGGSAASNTVTVIKLYTLHVLIDGIENDTFAYAGRPYNISAYVNDSDGNVVTSTDFVFTEYNGLNPFTPTQIWNSSGTLFGMSSASVGYIQSNASGIGMLAVIPTCNKLYSDPIRGPLLVAQIGPQSITARGYGAGFDITKPLYINDSSCADPGWVNNKEILNKDYVEPVYDYLYEMFSILKKIMIP
ncbi:MAG: CARDB domain-containing protein [Candidatus Micrarchaeota archaeon]